MTKKEIDYILKRLESYRIPFDHNIQDNEMTEEEIIRTLVKTIEDVLFSAMKCPDVDSGALIAICLMTLHEIGIITRGYGINTGKAESLNISEMHKDLMGLDEDS